jgi:iron complex outermembrane receptor protein
VPFDITTFPVTDPAAVALGAEDFDAANSVNYSIGAVFRNGSLNVTVDAYRIDVNDRIVLSENLTSQDVRDYLEGQGFLGSGGGRFFLNGVDTETTGIDMVANYAFPETDMGKFDATFGANFNRTDLTAVPDIPQFTALPSNPVLFDRVSVLTFEEGAPKDKFTASLGWERGPFGATVRAIRYGEVLVPSSNLANDYTVDPNTLLDIEGRYTWNERITLSIGADNVFDAYGDPASIVQNGTGNTPFSGYIPYGSSGRFVYGKASVKF